MSTVAARQVSTRLWVAIGIVLISLNLRPAVVAVSPLLDEISAEVGLTALTAGVLLTLPVLCFGAFGPIAPLLVKRIGMERTLGLVLALIIAGCALRLHPSIGALFAGTVLVGAGIAIGNILLPGIIKRDFPDRIGLMSGLYTMSITGGASLAAGITIPVARAANLDWNIALGAWGLLAFVALLAWLPAMLRPATGGGVQSRGGSIARDRIAWYVTAYMGLQSFYFYSMTAWLPTLLIARGFDALYAGWMLSVFNLVSIAPALLVPPLLARMRSQAGFSGGLIGVYIVGTLGFLLLPAASELWVVITGVAQGAALGFALTVIVLRSPDAEHATRLSGMAQSWGYLIAAGGPLLFGALGEFTGGWSASIVLLLVLLVPQAISGHLGGLPRMVGTVRESER